jgi:hypothetical protein
MKKAWRPRFERGMKRLLRLHPEAGDAASRLAS